MNYLLAVATSTILVSCITILVTSCINSQRDGVVYIDDDPVSKQMYDESLMWHFSQPPIYEYTESELAEIQERERAKMVKLSDKCYRSPECAKLAEAAYFEDRGGGVDGMGAVASVVLNRVNSPKFPDTIHAVVNQKRLNHKGVVVCQFSYKCQLSKLAMTEPEAKIEAGYVAWLVYIGEFEDNTGGADHYLNKRKVPVLPNWVYSMEKTVKIGEHTFYASRT